MESRQPWYVGEEGVSGGWVGIYADDHKVIGRAESDDFDDEETLAHANVMAVSPEMLETLKDTLDWLSSFSMPPTSTIAEKQEAIAKLEAVIAKAEGTVTR